MVQDGWCDVRDLYILAFGTGGELLAVGDDERCAFSWGTAAVSTFRRVAMVCGDDDQLVFTIESFAFMHCLKNLTHLFIRGGVGLGVGG